MYQSFENTDTLQRLPNGNNNKNDVNDISNNNNSSRNNNNDNNSNNYSNTSKNNDNNNHNINSNNKNNNIIMENSENTGSSTPQLKPKEHNRKLPYVGTVRLLTDLNRVEIAFLVLAFVSVVTALVITFIRVLQSKHGQPDFTFGILLIINLFFVLLYTVNGVMCEKPFEILMSVLATLSVMLYCIIEYATNGYKNPPVKRNEKLARLVTTCVLGPVDMGLGFVIAWKYLASKRLIFRMVGGKVELQNMCQLMYSFTAFVKFDFQVVVSLLVLVLNGAGDKVLTLLQKITIGIGVPLSFFWMILGFLLIRFERRALSVVFWCVGLLFPAFVAYQLTRLGKNPDNQFLYPATIVVCCVGLVVRVVTMLLSGRVTQNFNKGLKEKVYGKSSSNVEKRGVRT